MSAEGVAYRRFEQMHGVVLLSGLIVLIGFCSLAIRVEAQDDTAGPSREEVVAGLVRNLDTNDYCQAEKISQALLAAVREEDVAMLVGALREGGKTLRQVAIVRALGKLADRRAGDALRFEIEHGSLPSQQEAATALGRLDSDWPVSILAGLVLNEGDLELRKRAASALGVLGSAKARFALRSSVPQRGVDTGVGKGLISAIEWASAWSDKSIDMTYVDNSFPRGRKVKLWYKGTPYLFYQPARRESVVKRISESKPRLLVCIHGEDMDFEGLFDICWRAGRKRKVAVIAPYFDHIRYPEYHNLNIHGPRADQMLHELVSHVGRKADLSVKELYLYGYGHGGGFVERFVAAYPHQVARAVFEAYDFTMPDKKLCFPEGTGENPFAPDLKIDEYEFLKSDFAVILRKGSPAFKAAKEFVESARNWAEENGVHMRLAVREVEVLQQIWEIAEEYLFRAN